MTEELLFYDLEVFKCDNFAVFLDENKSVVQIFHNDYDGCRELIRGKKLVGYNNHYYDDRVLPKMMDGESVAQIKDLNDEIIGGNENAGKLGKLKSTYDCFQQIDVSRPGLKKIEGNQGKMIFESDVPFDIDRPLTEEEIQEVIKYCTYDVKTTVDVFKMRHDNYFKAKKHLVSMIDNPSSSIEDWNTTTISANVLMNRPLPKWSDIRLGKYDANGDYELLKIVPEEIRELWQGQKGTQTLDQFDCEIQFGFGGLHGAHKYKRKFTNVRQWDVTSMYPHIILILGVLGPHAEKYRQILEDRIGLKKTNPELAAAYKIILNSVYGNLKNKYSILYNPEAARSVCFYGQIALYKLCEMLAPYATLVNINTDGIDFIPKVDEDKLQVIKSEWEKMFDLSLEDDYFDEFIQKDVNNYIGKKGDHLKVKGGDVARFYKDQPFKNNSIRIVDIAIVNKLVYGKDVVTTLEENLNDPHLFQYILQAGRTYKGTFDQNGNKYQNINRVFATKDSGIKLYKRRQDDGLVKFPDSPENMMLWNDETDKFTDFKNKVDLNFYYKLTTKNLERWE